MVPIKENIWAILFIGTGIFLAILIYLYWCIGRIILCENEYRPNDTQQINAEIAGTIDNRLKVNVMMQGLLSRNGRKSGERFVSLQTLPRKL